MIYPTISELTGDNYNRYQLAIATAKCARLITNEYVKQRAAAESALTGTKEGSSTIASMIDPALANEKAVKNAINSIQLQDGTAIGEGIYTAMRALQQAPKDPNKPDSVAPGAIVLLTDGSNTAGRAPMQAAAEARNAKVPIYTIAYGTENGYVDLDGKREPVPVDHELMKQIAATTNGDYYEAATLEQLDKVYDNIGTEVGYEKAEREVTSRFAGYGLAFAVLAALGAISLGAKWP
jgi:Ca-activated chloride channel family protein